MGIPTESLKMKQNKEHKPPSVGTYVDNAIEIYRAYGRKGSINPKYKPPGNPKAMRHFGDEIHDEIFNR